MKKENYNSFWMGGFEGADHINGRGIPLDMVADSGHLNHLNEDYARLAALGIRTVRESVGWRVSQPHLDTELDLTRAVTFARVAQLHGIQIIWTFMHYGAPQGVDLLDDSFIEHFAHYAEQVAVALKPHAVGAPVYNLINEISFLSWATSQTDYIAPYQGRAQGARSDAAVEGYRTKCRLVKAVLEGMKRVKKVSPDARFLHVEPVLHVVAPAGRPDLEELAAEVRGHQWQTWELLRGTMEPHLGGHPGALDLMGVNYYYNGQMEVVTDVHLAWEDPDPRRVPFSQLLNEAWHRYQRPLIIAETGHFDDRRAQWLDYVLSEALLAKEMGVPLEGVCIYPVVDRPCWHEPARIIKCGLIEATPEGRRWHPEYKQALLHWQNELQLQKAA